MAGIKGFGDGRTTAKGWRDAASGGVSGSRETAGRAVRVVAPARLHLGFLDLHGGLGRRFGSLGVSVAAFATQVRIEACDRFETQGDERDRAAALAHRLAGRLGLDPRARVTVAQAIPAHAGLGSGTQLAMALGAALRRFHGLPLDPAQDALALERGARSGVGAALFSSGGFVVDAGRGRDTLLPPVMARFEFPSDWRVLILHDPARQGVHGEEEREAFAALPPFPAAATAEICRRTLMQAMPAVVERDLAAFGEAITAIQGLVGDHFAPAQGGGRFTSPAVRDVAARLEALGAVGIGQSSWGPTGFAFAPDEASARAMAARAGATQGVRILVSAALNRGAEIHDA